MVKRECVQCGASFIAKYRTRLYCSGRCGQTARRRRDGVRPFRLAVVDGRKKCRTCKKWLPVEDFSLRKDRNQAPLTSCKPCMAASARAYTRSEAGRNARLARKYGVTLEWFKGKLRTQDNACAICRTSFDETRPVLDHCHSSGQARGLLCDHCNQGLGRFRDDPMILRRAARYVTAHGRG